MYEQHQYNGQHGGYGENRYGNSGFSCRPIVLDDYNSDLNFVVGADGLTGSCLHQDGFEYLWAGARATHGVSSGKVCFEVVVGEKLPVKMPETERTPHVVRVGWSTDFSSLQVGEDVMSYGYGGTAKCSVNNKFFDYGQPYTTNDVIGCYINLEAKSIFFTKNGHYLAEAFRLGPETNGLVFYPHVTVKNMKFHINFGLQCPYFPPVDGYTMIQYAPTNLLVRAIGSPDTRKDCQVIMMVGLPACGKSYWAAKYAKENKHKKFNILGTNAIIDRMKVMGLARQRNYHGRWDALIKQATDILNKILKIAERKNRNYILDQTNVYPGARKRKMNNFHGFHRIAAVLVNIEEVLEYRTKKREKEEGKLVPESAVMEMKANFTLPKVGGIFDEVWFIEESEEHSERLVEQFNKQGKEYKEHGLSRTGSDSQASVQNSPPTDSNHASRNGNRGHFQNDSRAPAPHSQDQEGAHGYSTHPRVRAPGAYDSRGSYNPSVPFAPPDVRPHTRFSLPQGHYVSGATRHNPGRERYSMAGQHGIPAPMHNRYMPYNSSHRYDVHSWHSIPYHEMPINRPLYYENRDPYSVQYTQGYEDAYGHDRAKVSDDHYSVPETRPSGCSRYEPLAEQSYGREPVENDYLPVHTERPPNSEWCQQYGGSRGNQGYPEHPHYGRGSSY